MYYYLHSAAFRFPHYAAQILNDITVLTLEFYITSRCRLRLKCDGTSAETRFRLSPKWTRPFKSAGASVQSTAGRRGVRISGSNAGYTMFRGSVRVELVRNLVAHGDAREGK